MGFSMSVDEGWVRKKLDLYRENIEILQSRGLLTGVIRIYLLFSLFFT